MNYEEFYFMVFGEPSSAWTDKNLNESCKILYGCGQGIENRRCVALIEDYKKIAQQEGRGGITPMLDHIIAMIKTGANLSNVEYWQNTQEKND